MFTRSSRSLQTNTVSAEALPRPPALRTLNTSRPDPFSPQMDELRESSLLKNDVTEIELAHLMALIENVQNYCSVCIKNGKYSEARMVQALETKINEAIEKQSSQTNPLLMNRISNNKINHSSSMNKSSDPVLVEYDKETVDRKKRIEIYHSSQWKQFEKFWDEKAKLYVIKEPQLSELEEKERELVQQGKQEAAMPYREKIEKIKNEEREKLQEKFQNDNRNAELNLMRKQQEEIKVFLFKREKMREKLIKRSHGMIYRPADPLEKMRPITLDRKFENVKRPASSMKSFEHSSSTNQCSRTPTSRPNKTPITMVSSLPQLKKNRISINDDSPIKNTPDLDSNDNCDKESVNSENIMKSNGSNDGSNKEGIYISDIDIEKVDMDSPPKTEKPKITSLAFSFKNVITTAKGLEDGTSNDTNE